MEQLQNYAKQPVTTKQQYKQGTREIHYIEKRITLEQPLGI